MSLETHFLGSFRLLFVVDIEECHTGIDNCHADANCTNTKGSFYCTCLNGYSGDGVLCSGRKISLVLKHCTSMLEPVITSSLLKHAKMAK